MIARLTAVSLLVTAPAAASAQQAAPEERVTRSLSPSTSSSALTLGEVLESVRQFHPDIISARLGVEAAEGQALAALGNFDTRWRTSGAATPEGYYQYRRLDTVVEQPTPLWGTRLFAGWRLGVGNIPDYYGFYDTLDRGEVRAGLEVPLWRDGPIDKARAELAKARLYREVAETDLGADLLLLQLEGAALYWDWVASGRLLVIQRQLLDLAVQRNEQLKRRVAVGDIPEVEQVENERVLRLREADVVAARRKLEQAALKLAIYLRDSQGEPVLVGEERLPPGGLPSPGPVPSLEEEYWVTEAQRNRPELRNVKLKQDIAGVEVDLARNQLAPAINVGATVSRDIGEGSRTLAPTEVLATVRLDIPLQAWGPRGRIDMAVAERAAVQAKARLVQDKVRVEVRDAISALRAALQRLELAREAAQIAQRLAEAERKSFELGNTTLLIVNLREQLAADAESSVVRALVDYHRSVAELMRAAGAPPVPPS